MKPPSTARTAGRSDWAERRFRRQPFIPLSFSSSKKARKAQETQSYQRFQHVGHTTFNTSGTNGPRSLSRAKVGTHSAFRAGSHTAAHTPKQGPSGWGRYYYPRSVPHVSETLRGQGAERRTLPLLGLGRGCSQRTQRASGQRCAYARRCPEASRPRWAALPAASIYSACFSGIERLDQAFRQSYYHTQRPRGQPFDACAEAALAGKMGAITLDFKESYHGRTLPHKRTDPRVFHGAFSGGAVSGNGGKISAECTRFFPLSGRSARRKKCHFGLERFFAAAWVRALHRQRFFGSPELPAQLSRLVGLLHTLPENPAPPVSGDRAGAGSSRP